MFSNRIEGTKTNEKVSDHSVSQHIHNEPITRAYISQRTATPSESLSLLSFARAHFFFLFFYFSSSPSLFFLFPLLPSSSHNLLFPSFSFLIGQHTAEMKFFQSSVAILGAIALIASPATAQYGAEDQAANQENPGGLKGIASFFKAYISGTLPSQNLFESEPVINNITDANYKATIFEDEWIVALYVFLLLFVFRVMDVYCMLVMFMDQRMKQEQGCERMQWTIKEQYNAREAESKEKKKV